MDPQLFIQKIRLRHFHALAAVAQQGSISGAAKVLKLSQPALSKTLAEVEQLCGTAIIKRHHLGVTLTYEGEQLLPYALAILNSLHHASDSLTPTAPDSVQIIRLAALTTVAMGMLPRILDTFHHRHPNVQIQLATLHNNVLLAGLRAQEYDIGIGRMAETTFMEGLHYELLFAEKLKLVVNPEHPLLESNVTLAAAMQWPVVISPEGTAPWRVAQRILASQQCSLPNTRVETSSTSLSRQLALRYNYIWFVPSGAVREDLAHHALAPLPLRFDDPGESVGIITANNANSSLLVEQLKRVIREQAIN